MFDKYKNYRIIGVIVVIVAIAVLFAANIRIRSVRQYRSDANNLVQEQQSISDLLNSTTKDEVDNKESSATRDDGAGDDNNPSDDTDMMSEMFNNSSEQENEKDDTGNSDYNAGAGENVVVSDNVSINDDNSQSGGDSQNSSSTGGEDISKDDNSDSGSDKADKKPAIISCTIEIRCDEATAKKSSIDNPGIRELIPDSGIILGQISYSGFEGISAYDVLSAAANMNGISVDTKWTTQYGGVYVTAIAGLEEMMVGRWSGWMYSVNGKVPMKTASSYNVENGDAIVWYYYAP